uniref:Uncharacterized protein n=1 Tax=Chromera velia CCMP2878 TaxID=1169474 RepID=A0A0G4HP58_9ALVE|eukprot:Cvel_7795.t1-p1 / transcript=Cvel_7795.t1 / gene=Cvel_7795 / organism=Chromera_velia_CCMP2878 / gene_product=Zinc finger protein 571, putative / transcript_product=Zinc finger protein 571, putative / location=Cvel_scaffold415:78496-79483(-) / protein_length=291 / sequence_SO=supercontig / SO=protein_coding / is_pseudo=false
MSSPWATGFHLYPLLVVFIRNVSSLWGTDTITDGCPDGTAGEVLKKRVPSERSLESSAAHYQPAESTPVICSTSHAGAAGWTFRSESFAEIFVAVVGLHIFEKLKEQTLIENNCLDRLSFPTCSRASSVLLSETTSAETAVEVNCASTESHADIVRHVVEKAYVNTGVKDTYARIVVVVESVNTVVNVIFAKIAVVVESVNMGAGETRAKNAGGGRFAYMAAISTGAGNAAVLEYASMVADVIIVESAEGQEYVNTVVSGSCAGNAKGVRYVNTTECVRLVQNARKTIRPL